MATTPSSKTPADSHEQASPEQPSFEQALGRLEEVVHLLEEGNLGLDDALARYEEGVGLLRKASELLERAQRRISLLSGVDSEGNPILRPMEDAATFASEPEVGGHAPTDSREKASSKRVRRSADQDLP